MKLSPCSRTQAIGACLLGVICVSTSRAEVTWTAGSKKDFRWSNPENWTGSTEPGRNVDVVLPTALPNPGKLPVSDAIVLTPGDSANSLVANASCTLSAGSLDLSDGKFDVAAGAKLHADSILKGNDLTKVGPGTLSLFGSNSYTGAVNVDGGTINVWGDQSGATGGWSLKGRDSAATPPENRNATTVNIMAGSSLAVAAGRKVELGNRTSNGGFALQMINVSGAVKNAGSLYVGRSATLNIENGGVWTQSGSATIESQGGGKAAMSVNPGGSFVYTSKIPFKISGKVSKLETAVTINGGDLTTGAQFLNEGSAPISHLILTNGGTLRLSADIPDLFAKEGSPIDLQMGFGGGIIDTQSHSMSVSVPVTDAATQKGSLTKVGDGALTLSASNPYTGDTFVNGGVLMLSGSLAGAAIISNYAMLGGTGSAAGITVNATGTLAPGGSVIGAISAGNLALNHAANLQVDVSGAVSDLANVSGKVSLEGEVALHVSLRERAKAGAAYVILHSMGGVAGYSDGARFAYSGNVLEEGEKFTVQSGTVSQAFRISYGANGGKDVVLTAE